MSFLGGRLYGAGMKIRAKTVTIENLGAIVCFCWTIFALKRPISTTYACC